MKICRNKLFEVQFTGIITLGLAYYLCFKHAKKLLPQRHVLQADEQALLVMYGRFLGALPLQPVLKYFTWLVNSTSTATTSGCMQPTETLQFPLTIMLHRKECYQIPG